MASYMDSRETAMAHFSLTAPVNETQIRTLHVGDTVSLSGTLYGIRDATLIHLFDRGRETRFNLENSALLHTAPNVKKVPRSEANPAGYEPICIGTTTSARMERFTRPLMDRYGVRIIIGKGGLEANSLDAFRALGGIYLAVVGGAAALQTTWIRTIEDVDLDDLNPESLWKFRVQGFGPLLVAMDSHGNSLYDQVAETAKSLREQALRSLGVKH